MKRCAVTIVLMSVLASGHAPAWAQAGWYVIPSFQVTEVFDDNVFGRTSGQRSDFISRFTPSLQFGYRSDPLTLLANAAFDAEVFANNPEQDDATSSKRAGINFKYLPIRPLTLGLDAAYTEARTLNTLTQTLALAPGIPANTLDFGRRRTTVLNASPSVAYQFTPATAGTAGYSYTYTSLEGQTTGTAQTTNSVHQPWLGLSHRFTPLDTGMFDYRVSVFEDSTTSTTTVSHAPTLGWTRQLTPQTTAGLKAGPRFSGGAVSPEISAFVGHQFKVFEQRATASLSYSRSEGVVVGQAGTVQSQSVTGSVGFEPLRLLRVSLGGSFAKFSGTTGSNSTVSDTTTYGVTAEASYQLLRWLTARASYSYSLQDQNTGDIRHNVFSLSLTASYPIRVDQ